MELPAPLADALEHDRILARQHEVEFRVVSRPSDGRPRSGPPDSQGTFDNPGDAVGLGRSLRDRDVTVLADGHGAYWHSIAPDKVDSQLLEIVCRDKELGPEEADREHQREHLRDTIERLRGDQQLAKAADVVRECEDQAEARDRLQAEPLSLSGDQANHLLSIRRLQLLTQQGRQEIEAELENAIRALSRLDAE